MYKCVSLITPGCMQTPLWICEVCISSASHHSDNYGTASNDHYHQFTCICTCELVCDNCSCILFLLSSQAGSSDHVTAFSWRSWAKWPRLSVTPLPSWYLLPMCDLWRDNDSHIICITSHHAYFSMFFCTSIYNNTWCINYSWLTRTFVESMHVSFCLHWTTS